MDPASPHRFYVAHSVYSAFSRELLRLSRDWRLGSPHSAASDLGPLAEGEIRRVMRQLEAAFAQGARVQCGAEPRPCAEDEDEELGMAPTIVTGCRSEMALISEPCRAPVLALVGFDDEAEGAHLACQVSGGHSVSIFGASETCDNALQAHFGRIFRDTTPFCEESYRSRLRWGADSQTSWIWEPMPDGRLARRSGAHGLVSSLVPHEARPNLPGVIPPPDEVRAVQGLAGPDGLIMLPG
jgi:acyl-CoA reductase-like NAD-dependent aldehyde dehydrogenase